VTFEPQRTAALVTGAASGIGLALAEALASRADSVVLADVDESGVTSAASDLRNAGYDAHAEVVDVGDPAQLSVLGKRTRELGIITTACLNAGVTATGTNLWETPAATAQFVLGVNTIGLINSIRAVVPILIAQEQPSTVVITASMAGMVTSAGSGVYAASKAAAVALGRSLRAELSQVAPLVSVVVCNPGMVRTNLMRTSAGQLPGVMDDELVEASHGALNGHGITPEAQAQAVMAAIDGGSFWVMPPHGDPFTDTMRTELTELLEEVRP